MLNVSLKDSEFSSFQQMIFRIAGISMTPAKKALVAGRLAKRLKHHGLDSYEDYFQLLSRQQDEMQVAVDLLTTNETYFFREPKHFDFLRDRVLPGHPAGRPFRIWSAACSSGEEPYTLAMLLADRLGDAPWDVFGSDISTQVLDKARRGLYPMERARGIPPALLRAHCLKGVGSQDGQLLIDPALRRRVQLAQINLNEPLPEVGEFDVIFLRNVMIYFQAETKRQVVARLLAKLRPGGIFIVGHSESLNGLAQGLETLAPSIYRKP
ncbi:protein-glutamate O-methyltransferase CheR [Thiobacillus sp.]|uniref:CheR family methyltransferase n=1 Tax=Thiobacillus sp. TaxID=924 RepID=UPI0025DF75DC|nr:protein-glutamate O-methyltransferase CheR [Thiobacillus sp.]MBT9541086.1 protein-glutamate O-methyltransferase CheR [Thiobacillus sp.]